MADGKRKGAVGEHGHGALDLMLCIDSIVMDTLQELCIASGRSDSAF